MATITQTSGVFLEKRSPFDPKYSVPAQHTSNQYQQNMRTSGALNSKKNSMLMSCSTDKRNMINNGAQQTEEIANQLNKRRNISH